MSDDKQMLPIWFFIGILFTVLGVIITATGINYVFNPQDKTILHELNPNLWWGFVILVTGILFLYPTVKEKMKKKGMTD